MKKTQKYDLQGIREIQKFLRNQDSSMSEANLLDGILRGDFPAERDKSGSVWLSDSRQARAWVKVQNTPQEPILRSKPGVSVNGMRDICSEFKVTVLSLLDWYRKREKNGCPMRKDEKTQTFSVSFDKMEKWLADRKPGVRHAA